MYRFLLTPRWIGLLVIAALTVPGCLWLAGWQFDRLHDAEEQNSQVRVNANAPGVGVAELTTVGGSVREADEYRAVTVTGRYDTEHQLYVRNRPREGSQGYHVLTPVIPAAGPAVLVDRGWVPAPVAGGSPAAPETPDGTVTVSGHLRPAEPPRPADDLPPAQVLRIDTAGIAATLPYPVLGGYVQLADQDPAVAVVDGLRSPTPPDLPGSSSELLHRSYGWQWYVFASIGPIGFVLLARREAADLSASKERSGGDQPRQNV